mmetsp:Transcript_17683/g.50646  ORF Transcript_17683/g.50646 Transcript_17683/m.50646 type:complete len:86 (+) Transcript_17683:117-374(+)
MGQRVIATSTHDGLGFLDPFATRSACCIEAASLVTFLEMGKTSSNHPLRFLFQCRENTQSGGTCVAITYESRAHTKLLLLADLLY